PIVPSADFSGRSGAGGYGDYVMQSDWSVGQIMKALEENGLSENTIVIFTSDNGPEYFAYERVRNINHKSSGEFRGIKRDLWEGGHRVPFIIRWPGVVSAGTVSNQLVSQVDLMATFAAIAQYKLPPSAAEDSYNILPLLK